MPGICARCNCPVYCAEERCAIGKVWHNFCFSCCECKKLLDSSSYESDGQELYCKNCLRWRSNAPDCFCEEDCGDQCRPFSTSCSTDYCDRPAPCNRQYLRRACGRPPCIVSPCRKASKCRCCVKKNRNRLYSLNDNLCQKCTVQQPCPSNQKIQVYLNASCDPCEEKSCRCCPGKPCCEKIQPCKVRCPTPPPCRVRCASPPMCQVPCRTRCDTPPPCRPKSCRVRCESPPPCRVRCNSPPSCRVRCNSPPSCRVRCNSPPSCRVRCKSPGSCSSPPRCQVSCESPGSCSSPPRCQASCESPRSCSSPPRCQVSCESPRSCSSPPRCQVSCEGPRSCCSPPRDLSPPNCLLNASANRNQRCRKCCPKPCKEPKVCCECETPPRCQDNCKVRMNPCCPSQRPRCRPAQYEPVVICSSQPACVVPVCNSPCNPCDKPCNPCSKPCNPCNTPCNPYSTPCNPCSKPCTCCSSSSCKQEDPVFSFEIMMPSENESNCRTSC